MSVTAHRVKRLQITFPGPCSVSGPITGAPAGAAVRIFLLTWPGLIPARVQTSTTGAYAFPKLAAGEWVVLARDESGTFNAVVKDRVITVA